MTSGVPEILIDWAKITSPDHLYSVLLPQIGAPVWHGRNLDALADSLMTGSINQIEPPYKITFVASNPIPGHIVEFARSVMRIFLDAALERSGLSIHVLL